MYISLFFLNMILKYLWDRNIEIGSRNFPKENWIITYLEDLYKIRNKIAHNIPIEENERNTVEALLNNIYNQLEVNLKYINLFREESTQTMLEETEDEEIFQNNKKIIDKYDNKANIMKIYCKLCGKELENNSDYCSNCSTNLKNDDISFKNLESSIKKLYEN